MDSIERMRRINDLTKELKQRGFASSSDDAIQQAHQIYGYDELEENVKHGIIANSQNDKNSRDSTMENNDVMYDRKISKVNEAVDTLTNKMNEIIKAINDLDSRLSDLKVKHDALAARPQVTVQARAEADDIAPARKEAHAQESHAETAHAAAGRKDDYDANQRTGGFQSQDVAIDKMFYFGKK